jgi:hypothetical protein
MGDTEAKKEKQFAILVQNNDPGALDTVKIQKQALEDNVKALLDQAYPSKPLLDILNHDISCEKDVVPVLVDLLHPFPRLRMCPQVTAFDTWINARLTYKAGSVLADNPYASYHYVAVDADVLAKRCKVCASIVYLLPTEHMK